MRTVMVLKRFNLLGATLDLLSRHVRSLPYTCKYKGA